MTGTTLAVSRPVGVNRDGMAFVHPGITYTQGEIDRVKALVAAGREPWTRTFEALKAGRFSNPKQYVHGRGGEIASGAFNSSIGIDGRCAHDLALLWRLTGDSAYADTAVRILNENAKWTSASNSGTGPLDNGKIFLLIEAAELVRDYPGWSAEERAAFGKTLRDVFYRNIRNGDRARWGNQGLTAFRGLLAMAIFLDDAKMYDRVWNYLTGRAHRPDDEPYPVGPAHLPSWPATYGDYCTSRTGTLSYGEEVDWGYDELLEYYIYRNGQCEESCRDQGHVMYGLLTYVAIAEMFWNQGDDLYGALDDRILTGLEWSLRYNLSDWEPTGFTEDESQATFANGLFYRARTRSDRWSAVAPSPDGRGPQGRGSGPFTQALMHYKVCAGVPAAKCAWLQQQWDRIHADNGYETWGGDGHHYEWTGWGTLKFKTDWMRGDPVTWRNGVRTSALHAVPGVVRAADWDFVPTNVVDRTSHHAQAGRWSAGDWALYTVKGSATDTWRNLTVVYSSQGAAEATVAMDGVELMTVSLPSTAGARGEVSAGAVRIPAGLGVFRFAVRSCDGAFEPIAFGFGATPTAGEPSATPGVDFQGGTVRVPIASLLAKETDPVSAVLKVGGREIAGSVDLSCGEASFELDPSVAGTGDALPAELRVTVAGAVYRQTFELVQGVAVRTGRSGWIREDVGRVGATGRWSAALADDGNWLTLDDETTFVPYETMADDATATVTMTLVPGVVREAAFGPGAKAGLAVVRIDGTNRYVFATADGPVTNFAAVAVDYAMATVKISLDYRTGQAVYSVDGREFGPFRLASDRRHLSTVGFSGLGFLTDLSGDYARLSVNANLARARQAEYPTVDAAVSSGQGPVELLWDASWTPTNGLVRSFVTSGHRLVVGGDAVYRLDDAGEGVLTVTVLGEEDRPEAAALTLEGPEIRIAVANARPGFRYGLARGAVPGGAFVPDETSWKTGEDLVGGAALSVAKEPASLTEFFKVVVQAIPQKGDWN